MPGLEIFVWTFSGILFTPQDMLCRIKSRLIFKMNFFHKKCNETLGQLLNLHLEILPTYKKRYGLSFHIYDLNSSVEKH